MKHFKLFSLLLLVVVSSAILLAGGTRVKPAQRQAPSKHDYKSQPRSHARTIGLSRVVHRGGNGNNLSAFLLSEGFEAATVPPTGWTLTNGDADITWDTAPVSGYGSGTASAYIDFFDYGPGAEGELDILATPVVVGLAATDSLIFDYAYTDYSATFSDDSLIVMISTNGGTTFNSIYRNGPPSLRTAPSTTSFFVPTAGQWATLRFGLPAGVVGGSVIVQFVGKNNYGNNLYIDNVTLGSPSTDDVGAFSIDITNPSGPGVQTPKAKVKNFGLTTETFPVTMNISPGGFTSTQTVTSLAGGAVLQVSFASWNPAPGTYSVTVFTNLGPDASRANDTLRTSILVIDSVTGAWSSLAAYTGGIAGGIANFWWAESSRVFTAGGADATNLTSCYFYDPVANTYTPKASLPVGRGFGKMVRVGNSLYLVSTVGAVFATPDGALYQYNPAADSWTTKTSTPAPLIQESAVCVWRDSLIITVGGSTSGFTGAVSSVRVYNTLTDSWTILAAPFPVAAMGLAAECIGNEIIVLGGVTAGPAISNVAYRGTIVPGSPISINWRPTANPYGQAVYRSATAAWNGRMLFGPSQSAGSNIGTIWGVNIADSTIRKYVPAMPAPLGNIPNMAVQATGAAVTFYMFGGYDGVANTTSASKYSISLAANDIASTTVDDPVAGVGKRQNGAFAPKATFTNVGTATQSSIPVRMKIFDRTGALVYLNNQTIASLATSTSQQVTFANFTPTDTGTYSARAVALNPGDINGLNDSTSVSFPILIVVSTFPYTENFEGPAARPGKGSSNQILSGGLGWSTGIISGVVNDWLRGTPAKTQLSGAHSGTMCYVTKDTGTYNNNHDASVNTPVFDFTSLSSDPKLEFWHNFQSETGFTGYDAGVVEYSTNGGSTWLRVEDSLGHVATPDSNWTTLNAFNWYNVNSLNGPIDGNKYSSLSGASTGSKFYTGNVNGWIKSTVTLVGTAGLSDVRLRFRWGTDGSIVAEGWAIDDVSILPATSTTTLNVGIALGWNLISNPVTNPIPGDSVRQMYPTSLNAYAFEFSGGYVQRFKLANGKGYWEKFPGAISAPVTGTLRTRDSVSVVGGWNIVGSISNTVDTNTIVSVPAGLRASNWFGYTAGYTAVTQLVPGKGYWVKSTGVGKFVLANPLARPSSAQGSGVEISEVLNTLTITDSKGGSQTLYFGADGQKQIPVAMYTMPPAPPVGAFDARFETADGGSMVQTHGVELTTPVEFAVSVQSDAYPLTITWKVAHASYAISAAGSSKDMTGEGSMKIANSSVNRFSVKLTGDSQLPKEFALSQNYPNPFNPTTSIKYALPVDSKVTMEIYNVVGQRVRTLVSDNQAAGYHAAEWNGVGNSGQQLSSGVYFLHLTAKGVNGASFNEIRKLMMLK